MTLSKPPDPKPSQRVGLRQEAPCSHPPSGRALDPSQLVGLCSLLSPTGLRGVALLHSGQRPITLEY